MGRRAAYPFASMTKVGDTFEFPRRASYAAARSAAAAWSKRLGAKFTVSKDGYSIRCWMVSPPTRQHKVTETSIQVDRGSPPPTINGRRVKYPLAALPVGASITIEGARRSREAVLYWEKKTGMKFTRSRTDAGVACCRIK
jgi:hypothetical protein